MGGSYDAGVTPIPDLHHVGRDDRCVPDLDLTDAQRHSGKRRLVFAAVSGLIAALVVSWFVPWQLSVLVTWDVMALLFVGRAWSHVWSLSAADTHAYATYEDDGRTLADFVLLAASTVSLVGVAFAFVKANEVSSGEELVIKIVGIVTILLAWLVVHTILTFRYAHVYYREPVGGINFKSVDDDPDPDYRDFAYLAFTVGMTYQVADTDVTHRSMRRVVLGHALLSFVFGSVILATTVNLIANLLNS
jgi:uncharacterized membrane protein